MGNDELCDVTAIGSVKFIMHDSLLKYLIILGWCLS